MELADTRLIPAAPADVWHALNDVDVLRASIPGCDSLEPTGDNAYRAVVTARIGPISASFNGRLMMTDIEAPHAYTLRFEGQGGAAGFANGEARVTLSSADAGATSMAYAVNAQVGGKLAQIGSRLIDGAARKLADDFFANFAAQFAAPVATDPPEVTVEADAARVPIAAMASRVGVEMPTTSAPAPVRAASGRSAWTRYISFAAIIVILAILYFRGGHFR